jgi:hypothetical protein
MLPAYIAVQTQRTPAKGLLALPDQLLLKCLANLDLVALHSSVRLTNARLFSLCMHLVRTALLHAYTAAVQPPFSADPMNAHTSTLDRPHQELKLLDQFCACYLYQAKMRDESELHLLASERIKEAYPALFSLYQPQARLADLIESQSLPSPASPLLRTHQVTCSTTPHSRSCRATCTSSTLGVE